MVDCEKHSSMKAKKINWYVAPADDHTNNVIRSYKEELSKQHDYIPEKQGLYNLWHTDFSFIAKLERSKVSKAVVYTIYIQYDDGPLMRWIPFSRNKKKTVLILHPVYDAEEANIRKNIKSIVAICAQIFGNYKNINPLAPYLDAIVALKPNNPKDRERGIDAMLELVGRKIADEVWLYGDFISEGMAAIILYAKRLGIPVIAKTEGAKKDLPRIFGLG